MDKMKCETGSGVERNVDKIATMFPQVVTEVKGEDGKITRAVKWNVLKELLSGEYVEGDECYDFTWPGKCAAIAEAARPIRKTLRPCKEESKGWDATENLYIEGDNLEVLKLLRESYLGKVKMIYIDPPYNTGNDFVYKDKFIRDKETSEEELGLFDAGNNNRTMSGELFRNTEANGRFHSDWCSMMYPRLALARDMLSEDGVIFISIDDNEFENVKKICFEIFGSQNYIATIARKTKTTSNNGNQFAPSHEYIIVCAKQLSRLNNFNDPEVQEDEDYIKLFRYEDDYGKYNIIGLYQPALKHGGSSYPIKCPDGTYVVTPKNRPWRWNEQTFLKNQKENRVVFKETKTSPLLTIDGKQAGWNIYTKLYLKDRLESGMRPITFFDKYPNSEASKELIKMGLPFDFSKPRRLIQYLIKICIANDESIICDFFSGSATTAHAVMQLNAEDGGKRKFIMVQLPEECPPDSEAAKAGYKNICEIGKERIRRAGAKIKEEAGLAAANLDVGFRVFKVADSNMKDVFYSAAEYSQDVIETLVTNIKEDRTDLDLLYGCLLEWGVELSLPHTSEKIDGVTVHTVNGGDLIACFDPNIPESAIRAIAKRQPLRAVFRDSSFASAPQKINVEEIFKLLSPATTIKVI